MFDQSSIGIEDLACIHRDQFVHYLQLAHALGDPQDGSGFRQALLSALTAAFGLAAGMDVGRPRREERPCGSSIRSACSTALAADWPTFFGTLSSRRHDIRADLPRARPARRLVPRSQGAVTSRGPQGQFPHETRQTVRGLR